MDQKSNLREKKVNEGRERGEDQKSKVVKRREEQPVTIRSCSAP